MGVFLFVLGSSFVVRSVQTGRCAFKSTLSDFSTTITVRIEPHRGRCRQRTQNPPRWTELQSRTLVPRLM